MSKNATTTPADETKPPADETKPAAGETKRPSAETKTPDSETQKPVLGTENAVSETKTGKTEMSKAASKTPSIKMKDEAAEKLAQKQEDDLAALFDTPEFGIMRGDEGKHRLRGRPSGLVDKLFHPFSDFLSSHHGVEVDRRNGTPVAPGVIRDAFEAFAPDEEQRALFSKVFDVAEKLGCDYRIDHGQPNGKEVAYEIGGHITFHADKLDERHGKDVAETILHELIHGVTSYAINISENVGGVEGVRMSPALHDAVRRLRVAYNANKDLMPEDYD